MRLRRSKASSDAGGLVVRRHRPDYQIVLFMGILMLVGLIVLYSISPARVELINANTDSALGAGYFMQRQLINLFIGIVVFVVAANIPVQQWRKYAWPLLMASFATSAALAFLGLFLDGGPIIKTNGAVRWFNLGFTSFQPAELLKFASIIYLSVFLGRRVADGKLNDFNNTLVPLGVIVGIGILFVIVFQKDMGTGLTLIGAVLAMMFASGMNRRLLTLTVASLLAGGIMMIVTSPHRIERVVTFLQHSSATDASTYHIDQAMIALGSGGLFGKGLGQGVQAFGYLPEAINDSIFAILGETFGFIGLMVIMMLFGALLRRVLVVADKTVDVTNRLIVIGVFGLLTSHIVVNIGAMTGVFPLTGVTLPFLSFGGTSLLFTMLALGVVFYISRYTTHQEIVTKEEGSNEASLRRRRVGRTRNTGHRGY